MQDEGQVIVFSDRIRIISAREATRQERGFYEEGN
jgi:uncharacterized DUF497 family protein